MTGSDRGNDHCDMPAIYGTLTQELAAAQSICFSLLKVDGSNLAEATIRAGDVVGVLDRAYRDVIVVTRPHGCRTDRGMAGAVAEAIVLALVEARTLHHDLNLVHVHGVRRSPELRFARVNADTLVRAVDRARKVLARALTNELAMPMTLAAMARWIAGWAVELLPVKDREEYREVFDSETWELAEQRAGWWTQVRYATRLLVRAPALHVALRAASAKEAALATLQEEAE